MAWTPGDVRTPACRSPFIVASETSQPAARALFHLASSLEVNSVNVRSSCFTLHSSLKMRVWAEGDFVPQKCWTRALYTETPSCGGERLKTVSTSGWTVLRPLLSLTLMECVSSS